MVTIPKTKKIIATFTSSVIGSMLLLNGLSSPASAVSTTQNTNQYTSNSPQYTSNSRQLQDKLSQPVINKLVVAAVVTTGLGVILGTGVSIKHQRRSPFNHPD